MSIKRICENKYHPETELKEFEECPYCHSTAYHLMKVDLTDDKFLTNDSLTNNKTIKEEKT